MRDERGAALIFVLWFAIAMSAVAVELTAGTRTTGLQARNVVRAIETEAAIDGAVELMVGMLREDALEPEAFAADERVRWTMGDVEVRVGLQQESALIDLNAAGDALIEGLMMSVVDDADRATELAHAVLDWRDANDSRRLQGAEARDYREAGRLHGPADAPFRYVEELRRVLGIDEALYERLRPLVTVYTGGEQPDEALMDEPVRRAYDLARGLINERDEEEGFGFGEEDEAEPVEGEGADEMGSGEADGAPPTGEPPPDDAGGEAGFGDEADGEAESGENGAGFTFGDDDPSIGEDDDDDGEAAVVIRDPAGIYTLDLEARHREGYTQRRRITVALEAGGDEQAFAILHSESALLPYREDPTWSRARRPTPETTAAF